MKKSLNNLKPGEKATVSSILPAAGSHRTRLIEMGITYGTSVEFIRRAPLGDPIEIKIAGSRLSLRSTEAAAIIVEEVGRGSHH